MLDRLARANITVYDASLPGTRVLRVATGNGHMTRPSDVPANTYYLPNLKQPADISRHMFAPGTTSGRSKVGLGDVVILNADGALDGWMNHAFDGWPITIEEGNPVDGFTSVLVATMDGTPDFAKDTITIHLRDRQAELDTALQKNLYAGNNILPAGVEGVSDLKGKPKPFCLGQVLNVPAVCVNTAKLIYQVHDGAIAALTSVYDKAVPLTFSFPAALGPQPFGTSLPLGCAYGNGVFVAVALGNKIARSTDNGVTWTLVASAVSAYSGYLAYGGGKWVVGASNGQVAVSADNGLTWTAYATGLGVDTVNGIAYDGVGLWLLGGTNGKCATSVNATAWTLGTSGFGTTHIYAVGYGAGTWVLAGVDGKLSTSPEALTFTAQTSRFVFGDTIQVIAFAVRTWVIGGTVGSGSPGVCISADGGTTWTPRTVDLNTSFVASIAYGNGLWVLGAGNGKLYTSSNMDVLTTRASGFTSGVLYGAAYGAGTFVIVGGAGSTPKIAASTGNGTYASLANLLDDTLAPAPGTFKVYLAGGLFRLGSSPAGALTADVLEGATAADRTVAQLFKRALLKAGKSAIDYVAADLVTHDALNSAVCGIWINDSATTSSVLDQIAGSSWSSWAPDRGGLYRLKQFSAPSGSPTFTITANDLRKPLEVISMSDAGKGVPAYRTIVRYARNYTVQTTDVAGSVDAVRRGTLAAEWRAAQYETAGVQSAHLLAPEIVEDSLLVNEADALAAATRRQGIRGTRRDRFPVLIELTAANAAIDFGDVGTLTHPRFGLAAGTLVRVLGAEPNKEKNEVLLTVWR